MTRREVARTRARRLGHPARAGFFLVFFNQPPTPRLDIHEYLVTLVTQYPWRHQIHTIFMEISDLLRSLIHEYLVTISDEHGDFSPSH